MSVERVRVLGRWPGLSDAVLAALWLQAQSEVQSDLARLGLSPDPPTVELLVDLRTCWLASRIARTPRTESAGGVSAQYEPLSWAYEYAKKLNEVRLAQKGAIPGGNL